MNVFFTALLRLSLLGSALGMLLLLLRRLLGGRVAHGVFYYLWLLVLLRLCLPAGLTLTLPAPTAEPQTAPPPAVVQPAEEVPGQAAPLPITPAPAAPKAPAPVAPAEDSGPDLWVVLAGIWALGTAASLGWHAAGYLRFRRRVEGCWQPAAPAAMDALRALDPGGRVQLMECRLVSGPLLLGPLRPVILLPPGVETDRLEDILAHELTHVRRHDLLYKWLTAAVTSLHWFNPLMPLYRREIGHLCELSCDQVVTRKMDAGARRRYGETLLAMAAPPPAGLLGLGATLCEGKRKLEERLVSVARGGARGTAALVLSVLLVLGAGGCALISGTETEAPPVAYDPAADPAVPVLRAAMLGEETIRLDHNEDMLIDDIPSSIYFSPDSPYAAVSRFAPVDLDGDGQTEVVVQIIDAAGDMGGYLMLYWNGYYIHGYKVSYQWFETLKADGTFTFTDNVGVGWGVADPLFHYERDARGERGGFHTNHILWQEPRDEPSKWFIGRKRVSERAYNAALEEFYAKPDAVWYDHSPEAVAQAFPGGTGQWDGGSRLAAIAILERLYSSTLDQAEELDQAFLQSMEESTPPEGGIGMATPGDAWDNYLAQRFGDGLTDECLNTFIKNRETNRAAALAKSTGSDIQAGGVELANRSGDDGLYNFTVKLKTAAGEVAGTVTGTIHLEQQDKEWVVKNITINR